MDKDQDSVGHLNVTLYCLPDFSVKMEFLLFPWYLAGSYSCLYYSASFSVTVLLPPPTSVCVSPK